jgi:hypothetical protein
MHHPTLFDANLLLLCFLWGSTYWRVHHLYIVFDRTPAKLIVIVMSGEDRFDERIELFYRSLTGAYTLFLIS